jgi:hypothetical protein
MVYLPEELEENEIGCMMDEESGYTVPWAMYADQNGQLFLNEKYTLQDNPRGTASMKISKIDSKYIVDITNLGFEHGFKWSRGSSDSYVGGCNGIPVDKLIQ